MPHEVGSQAYLGGYGKRVRIISVKGDEVQIEYGGKRDWVLDDCLHHEPPKMPSDPVEAMWVGKRARRFTEGEIKQIEHLWLDRGLPVERISAKVNIPSHLVLRWLQQEGLGDKRGWRMADEDMWVFEDSDAVRGGGA